LGELSPWLGLRGSWGRQLAASLLLELSFVEKTSIYHSDLAPPAKIIPIEITYCHKIVN
jgi:hypothetical protein